MKMTSATMQLKRNQCYYQEFGKLFNILSEQSKFYNLGLLKPEPGLVRPAEIQAALVAVVAQAGALATEMRVLDVGCGQGGPARFLAEKIGCEMVGLDPLHAHFSDSDQSPAPVQTEGQVRFVAGEAPALPFRDRTFDRVLSIESAFHYADKQRFMSESARVLKPGGRVVIADILKSSSAWLPPFIRRSVAAARFYAPEDYCSAAQASGLTVLETQDISASVRKAFTVWRSAFWRNWAALRADYSVRTLLIIGCAMILIPFLSRWLGMRYQILVFGSGRDADFEC